MLAVSRCGINANHLKLRKYLIYFQRECVHTSKKHFIYFSPVILGIFLAQNIFKVFEEEML